MMTQHRQILVIISNSVIVQKNKNDVMQIRRQMRRLYMFARNTNMWKSFLLIIYLIAMSSWMFAQESTILPLEMRKTGVVSVTKDASDNVTSIKLIVSQKLSYDIKLDKGSKPLEAMDGQKVRVLCNISAENGKTILTIKNFEPIIADAATSVATPASTTTQKTGQESKSRTESSVTSTDQQETGYWITTSSSKRHNKNCRYYKNSKGRFCGPNDGIACKICGG